MYSQNKKDEQTELLKKVGLSLHFFTLFDNTALF